MRSAESFIARPWAPASRVLAFVLLASALKLLNVSNTHTIVALVLVLVFAPLAWMLVRRRHGFPALTFSVARLSG